MLPTAALMLLPFLIALSLAEMVGGAMGLYSSGLTLLMLGLQVPRAVAAGLDGLLVTLGSMIAGTFVGWGLVTSSTSATIVAWQVFLFDIIGVAELSESRVSDPGVIVALLIGCAGTRAFGRARVRRQEFVADEPQPL